MLKRLLALLAAVACIFTFTACVADYRAVRDSGGPDISYIMYFEGERVDFNDFVSYVLFLVTLGADGSFVEIKADALNMLIRSRAVEYNAARLGIVLTETERAEIRDDITAELSTSSVRLVDAMVMIIEEDMLMQRIIEAVELEIAENPTELEEFLDIYGNHLRTYVYYIVTTEYENAAQAQTRLKSGEDGLAVVQDLSLAYLIGISEGRGNILELSTFVDMQHINILLELDLFDVSEIIALDGIYLVAMVDELAELDYEFILNAFATSTVLQRQQMWFLNSVVELNLPAFNSLEPSHINDLS